MRALSMSLATAVAATIATTSVCFSAQLSPRLTSVERQAQTKGYLGPFRPSEVVHLLPPPPKPGTPQSNEDLALFRDTRPLQGGPRWRLAQRDVTDAPLETFACALGVTLKTGDAPALDRLLTRLGADRGPWVDAVKFHYAARRPYLIAKGPICEPKTEHLRNNPDYPSGHAAAGWSIALVLAELEPERAGQILTRGRVFAESRIICGSHSKSAVDAGVMLASDLVAVEHGSDAFRADLNLARMQLRAPQTGVRIGDAGRCDAEAVSAAWTER